MGTERGLQRLVNFSDAVVAIAITLLVLPLVDAASSIGTTGLGHFFDDSKPRLLAFTLSFAVIGSFWWGQHQMFERVRTYNVGLVLATFVWLFSIVFLPFPTELLGASRQSSVAVHGIYVGTMVVAAVATLVQQWTIVRWPELQDEEGRGSANTDSALVLAVFMAAALVVVLTLPAVGLWSLLLLVLSRPIEHLLATRRRTSAG